MNTSAAWLRLLCAACAILSAPCAGAFAQEGRANAPTKTIVGDLLMIDGDFYIVRGDRGEIQIEVVPDTKVAEPLQFGDRIKAVTLMNNKALTITRAGPDDAPGVAHHESSTSPAPAASTGEPKKNATQDAAPSTGGEASDRVLPTQDAAPSGPIQRPTHKTIVGDLLMIDGDFYIVRGDRGEIQIEAAPDTKVADPLQFGDRIKALTLMNNTALTISRAGPDDETGVTVHGASSPPGAGAGPAQAPDDAGADAPSRASGIDPASSDAGRDDGIKVVEGRILMVDGDFYVIRGELGEIRIERTPETRMTETFQFGDDIKATVTRTDRALSIERLH